MAHADNSVQQETVGHTPSFLKCSRYNPNCPQTLRMILVRTGKQPNYVSDIIERLQKTVSIKYVNII